MRRAIRAMGGLACGLALSISARAQAVDTGRIATGQVSVGTTATQIVPAGVRNSIDVTVDGAVKCYLGAAGVTTTTGFPLQAVAGASKTIPSSSAVYAVCASTVTVGFMQHY
jgi:hypothetical protein